MMKRYQSAYTGIVQNEDNSQLNKCQLSTYPVVLLGLFQGGGGSPGPDFSRGTQDFLSPFGLY